MNNMEEYKGCCDAEVINGICQECGQDLKAYWKAIHLAGKVEKARIEAELAMSKIKPIDIEVLTITHF